MKSYKYDEEVQNTKNGGSFLRRSICVYRFATTYLLCGACVKAELDLATLTIGNEYGRQQIQAHKQTRCDSIGYAPYRSVWLLEPGPQEQHGSARGVRFRIRAPYRCGLPAGCDASLIKPRPAGAC